MSDEWEARCAKLEGVIVLLLREVKELKSRVTTKQARGDRRIEALEQQLLRDVDSRLTSERIERQSAHDGLLLRMGTAEEAREKDTAQHAIDRKQLELMFKTEMLSSYSDMEEHIEEEIQLFRDYLESDTVISEIEQRLCSRDEHRKATVEGGASVVLEQRVAALENQLQKQFKQISTVGDDTAAAKVSIIARVDDRMLALTRDLQTETAMVQQTLESSFDSFTAAQKNSEIEWQQKLWQLEKAMAKIEQSGQQVVQFSEEYMNAMQTVHGEQREQALNLEQLLLQRRDEMGMALEMLTRNVGQAESEIRSVAKELEIVQAAQSSVPSHVDAEYHTRMMEMGAALEALKVSGGPRDEGLRSLRAQMKEMENRLKRVEINKTVRS